jgi:hypothetical protein
MMRFVPGHMGVVKSFGPTVFINGRSGAKSGDHTQPYVAGALEGVTTHVELGHHQRITIVSVVTVGEDEDKEARRTGLFLTFC